MNLEKLDEVIEELEEQSKTLKNYNVAYSEIIKIKDDILNSGFILKKLESNNINFYKNLYKKEEEKALEANKREEEKKIVLEKGLKKIQSNNIEFHENLYKKEEEKKLDIKNNQKKTENILDEQSKTNKLFYKDLSGEVYSRLERSKLDLEINITKNNELLENKTKQYLDQNIELISKVYDEKQKMLGKKINKMQLLIIFLLFINISILFTIFLAI